MRNAPATSVRAAMTAPSCFDCRTEPTTRKTIPNTAIRWDRPNEYFYHSRLMKVIWCHVQSQNNNSINDIHLQFSIFNWQFRSPHNSLAKQISKNKQSLFHPTHDQRSKKKELWSSQNNISKTLSLMFWLPDWANYKKKSAKHSNQMRPPNLYNPF